MIRTKTYLVENIRGSPQVFDFHILEHLVDVLWLVKETSVLNYQVNIHSKTLTVVSALDEFELIGL